MPEATETLPILKSIDGLGQKANEYIPRMAAGKEKAVTRLKSQYEAIEIAAKNYDGSPNEEIDALVEDIGDTLSASKKAYDQWNAWRVELTGPMDEFKKQAMEFEKAVAYDGKTDNYYTKIRQQLVNIENKKIERKRKEEEAAQKKKDLENYKVDIATKVKKNLTQMLIERVHQVYTGSKEYFDGVKLEEFDKKATQFQSFKPKLKEEQYAACFKFDFDRSKINQDDYVNFIASLKAEEPYEKWNDAVAEAILPTLNEWRAKIPALKQGLIDLMNANSEAEKKRIQDEQDRIAKEEEDRKKVALEEAKANADRDIENEAAMSKMQNEFVAQATVQEMGDTAPVKYVYVMHDPKLMVKGLMNAIYHTVSNPKFKGIYKLDRSGKKVIDQETNSPQLIDEIAFWFKFCAANCDVELEGMKLIEVAKIAIKK